MSVLVRPLRELLLSDEWSNSSIKKALSAFACNRDNDVMRFLKQYAINNERNGSTRTYLALGPKAFDEGKLDLWGFYSISLTVVDYSDIDVEYRHELMGNVPGLQMSPSFPGFLVAQLARADSMGCGLLSGVDLLHSAEWTIYEASKIVGGRFLYLDCKNALVDYYEEHGYSELYMDEKTKLHKMLKRFEVLAP